MTENRSFNIDFIRAVAVVSLVVLHAAVYVPVADGQAANPCGWWTINFYASLASCTIPLFVMVSGAVLLVPSKVSESPKAFFRKRLLRVMVPFVGWGFVYFAWRSFVLKDWALTWGAVGLGFLERMPYYHFWYVYMLIGLYLVTPLLRVLTAHAPRRLLGYAIALWIFGTGLIPFIARFSQVWIGGGGLIADGSFFAGVVGFYLLGYYLRDVRVRGIFAGITLTGAFLWTFLGNWLMTVVQFAAEDMPKKPLYMPLFFTDFLGINIMVYSAVLFLLLINLDLARFKAQSWLNRGVQAVSWNSLNIYFLHILVMESIELGYFGLSLNVTTMNPLCEVPLLATLVLLISLGVVLILTKAWSGLVRVTKGI